jgi:predicted transposase/invertase (TIGR01784 family)
VVKYNFTYDLVFKAALEACPLAVIKLIKEFVSDLKDISFDEKITFLKQENIKGVDIKATIFDVNLNIANNLIELEMQKNKMCYDMRKRMLKYFTDMVSLAFDKGDDYTHKPCYSVWFIGFKMFEDKESIHEIELMDNIRKNSFVEEAKIIIVEFEKFKDIDYNKNRWYKLFKTNDLESLKGDDEIMNELADKIENLNNDTEFIRRIDYRERAEREYNARMNAATEQGLKQGMEQGAKQEKIAIAKNALSMNMPIEQIIKLTGLTKEEIESL